MFGLTINIYNWFKILHFVLVVQFLTHWTIWKLLSEYFSKSIGIFYSWLLFIKICFRSKEFILINVKIKTKYKNDSKVNQTIHFLIYSPSNHRLLQFVFQLRIYLRNKIFITLLKVNTFNKVVIANNLLHLKAL